jgi:integrase/recombinase XerC
VAKNPTIKIITPKIPKRLPEFIQEKNIAQLFDNLIEGDFEEFRDRLIIELFYITGMRKIELINLSDDDIDMSNNVVKVLGKGNKERLCPLLESILSKINRYKELRDSFFEGDLHSKHLFVTSKGAKMYPKFVYNLVKSYLSTITTLNKRSPHILRHSFATHLMNGGADLNAVKELLGHANLAATQIYTHNSIEKLKEVYKNAHPKSENK